MDAPPSTDIALFEGFRLDRRSGALFRRDERGVYAPVAIGSRALDILRVLVERPEDLVSRAEILAAVWPGTVVEDSNLNVQIAALRRVLDDGRAEGSWIQTVSGRGYRFMAPVSRAEPSPPPAFFPSSGDGAEGTIALDQQPEVRPSATDHPDGLAVPIARGRRRPRRGIMAGVIAALVLITAAVAAWYSPWFGETRPTPRLSIVVLPFANLGNDPSQQYFADGITEDLTTDLSGLAHMLVISAGTAFTYRDQPIKVKQISRELGIRYVLEGSVQRSGSKMRINAQLVDAETDTHLWAEQFDGDSGDLFALQTEITRRIAAALNVELIAKEAARPAEHPDALDYILRGRAAAKNGNTRDTFSQAIAMYEHALAIEPQSVEARTDLGQTLAARVLAGMSNSRAADVARAKDLIAESLAISPGSAPAHFARGQLLRAERRGDEAIHEFEMVIASNPNSANAFFALGVCKLWTGSIDEAIPLEETAIRLSPRDPAVFNRYLTIGQAQLLRSHTDEAILSLERARTGNPESLFPHAWLASAYGLKGDLARAAAELAEVQRTGDRGSYPTITYLNRWVPAPSIRPLYEATYLAGLRKAGVPEE